MTVNLAEMESQGWGRELAILCAHGYRCVHDNGDGELPVALFAKVEDGFVKVIQGMDFDLSDGDDSACAMFPADNFEEIASTIMGMIMESRRAARTPLDGGRQ